VTRLAALAERYPADISGGQQQRVALARALVVEPEILLLDEPLSNLDANLREEMRFEIRRLHDRYRYTTVYVTHDQAEAMTTADLIAVMNLGRIEQVGTPEEIYRRPANRFVAEFVGRVNLLGGVIASRDGETVVVDVDNSGRRLCVAAPGFERRSGHLTLAFRPEAVTLLPAGDSSLNGTNTWEADVHAVAFLGDHYEYEVNAGPLALTVVSPRRVPSDRLRVHIPPDACSVVE
jgi:iron(III) transport system ATP-binding protein